MDDRFYFRQLLSGRDYATSDPIAQQMVNFSYLIGDREAGECLVVDPAYDVAGIVAAAEADDMRIAGALVTHYHADHCGGSMMGFDIEGIEALIETTGVPVHLQSAEVPWVTRTTGCTESDLVAHAPGDVVSVGALDVELIHTPGHTPGSQCFLVHDCLVSGDTLFLDGCGRTDLPGGDPEELYFSLTQRLAKVPDSAVLFPGHRYSPAPSAGMGDTREHNFVFRPKSPEQWMAMFGG
ncbi:MAG: MBL fold metallo-hydrolase [Acidimicrobiales bacterium]